MGQSFDAVCAQCGTFFTARFGGGFMFHLLHCDGCGKEKVIEFKKNAKIQIQNLDNGQVEDLAGQCECGGNFTFDAKPRCPKCGSLDYEPGSKDGVANIILYD